MSFSLVIQVLSAFFSLLIALIVLRNIKQNPYLNIFILLIFTLNLIRIPFSLTYELGWQTDFREIPKPFNILFLSNVVFFHYYIRSLVLKERSVHWNTFGFHYLSHCFCFLLICCLLPSKDMSWYSKGLIFQSQQALSFISFLNRCISFTERCGDHLEKFCVLLIISWFEFGC